MNRLAVTLGALAVVALGLALAGFNAAFGVASWAILTLLVTAGFGGFGAPKRVLVWALGLFVLFSSLLLWIFALDAPQADLQLWWGLPRATAVLIYGIWPLGVLPGVLYAIEFSREVLPDEKLRAFRAALSEDVSTAPAGRQTEPRP